MLLRQLEVSHEVRMPRQSGKGFRENVQLAPLVHVERYGLEVSTVHDADIGLAIRTNERDEDALPELHTTGGRVLRDLDVENQLHGRVESACTNVDEGTLTSAVVFLLIEDTVGCTVDFLESDTHRIPINEVGNLPATNPAIFA